MPKKIAALKRQSATKSSRIKKTQTQLKKIVAFIATENAARAKHFYRETLGLRLVSEDNFAIVFDVGGTMLRLTTVPKLAREAYTVLGWDVSDIIETVVKLESAGVLFERYPGLQQDEHGIWTAPSGAKVAWFKDPDGNTLSLTQF